MANQGQRSQWSRGYHAGHHRMGTSREQQFSNPYQDCQNNPKEWFAPRHPYVPGAQRTQYQTSRGWQHSGSPHTTPRGQSGSFCNKDDHFQQKQQDVDIRNYVIPAMTGNPWKHLEEEWNTDNSSATSALT
ncbi:hypothetical protein DICVIV_07124 [Dictyocaulus viviparus]|uniref:Uncharacterized protein n=1 Tax=Dictyocaulus viviparus TaxID=29172 RepID=A0A0D8XQ81_DICVI|nr:hypothetical protein DICVIV_07124 [Dictyocaulus viviparus]